MKTTKEVIGLPVFSVKEVIDIGNVKDLLINPDEGTVDFLLVEPKRTFIEKTVIKYEDVIGVGKDAVTVEDKNKVVDVLSVPEVKSLLEKDTKVIGCKVMTNKGTFVGEITEIAIDEDTGKIVGCQWLPDDKDEPVGYIPGSCVITFGREILIVDENFEQHVTDKILVSDVESGLDKDTSSVENMNNIINADEQIEKENVGIEGKAADDDTSLDNMSMENIDINVQAEESSIGNTDMAEQAEKNAIGREENIDDNLNGDPLEFFENKQDEYLIGRKVNVTIVADNGEIIANEGDIVTPEIIERARANDKYVSLILNTIEE